MRNLAAGILFLLSGLFVFNSCLPVEQANKQIILESYLLHSPDTSIEVSGSGSSSVYASLSDAHINPDPFVACKENHSRWIEAMTWIYSYSFSLSETDLRHSKAFLQLEGIDLYANIRLNGHALMHTNNAFRNYEIQVKDFLIEGENLLEIELLPIEQEAKKIKKQFNMNFPGGDRVLTRKAQYQFGWDWAPSLLDRGVYHAPTISFLHKAQIRKVTIQTLELDKEKAVLGFSYQIYSPKKHTFTLAINGEKHHLDLAKGNTDTLIKYEIKNPDLWYPHNYGSSTMYTFQSELFDGDIAIQQVQNQYGIREVKLKLDALEKGSEFAFEINGEEIYMKGANMVPAHHFIPKASDKKYEALVWLAKSSNMNMIRVWGGGYYLPEAFYNACDRMGIAVWQDFMFAGGMYPMEIIDSLEFIQQIERLSQHPSVVLYCGNNEISEGWHNWGWQQGYTVEQREHMWNDYQSLFQQALPKLVRNYHPGTPYWESSPSLGRGNPNYIYEGDAHNWWVWHDDSAFTNYERQVPRFMSEFGFQALPIEKTLRAMNVDSLLPSRTELQCHQKHHSGFKRIQTAMQRNLPMPKTMEDSIYLSQVLQALGIEKGVLAQRTNSRCKGSLVWQLNDCWPSISWSIIDFNLEPKALFYRLKKNFEPLVFRSSIDRDSIRIFIGNEKNPEEGILFLQIKTMDGTVVDSLSILLNIQKNQQGWVYSMSNPEDVDWRRHYFRLEFIGKNTTTKHLQFGVPLKDLELENFALSSHFNEQKQYIQLKASSLSLFIRINRDISELESLKDNFFHLEAGEEMKFTGDIEDMRSIIYLNRFYLFH
jgi:beta-mannosidase